MEKHNTLYIMCGIAASGKSTQAAAIKESTNAIIVSTDIIRKMLYGNDSIQGKWDIISYVAKSHMVATGELDMDCIYDATNLTRQARADIIESMDEHFNQIICVFCDTPIKQALINNNHRTRHVPPRVIRNQSKKLQIPTVEEGFKEIKIF